MPDSMIERIARILSSDDHRALRRGIFDAGEVSNAAWVDWQAHACPARAIVAAMREPTKRMSAEAVLLAMARGGEHVSRTMIDIALAEKHGDIS